ncbi:MAG TPA: amidoligase family protein [Armatimonadota bacterium]|nr:amidoligase family protein [Armatimonadota bacterium]
MPITIQEIRFGLEIETVGRTRRDVATAICSVVGGNVEHVATPACYDPYHVTDTDGRVWKVVADSSLTNVSADFRAEIVSPILCYDDIPLLQQIVRAVRQAGARCDERCGLHLHLSHPSVTPKALAILAKTMFKQEELIYAALGVTQERMARYCKPLNPAFIDRVSRATPKTFPQLNRMWYGKYNPTPQRYDSTRYAILNLNAFFLRGAVEMRAYAGSLHAGKVKAAIQFGMALLVKALNTHAASAKKRKYDPASARYDFRVFLISALGMNGDEFKTARKHLLTLMPGDAAFKYGRPTGKAMKTEETIEVGAEMLQPSC